MTDNERAFLDMLAVSEIGAELLAVSDNGYNVLVGSTAAHPLLFDSYADHPNVLNKALNSTAAGRYQILHRFWVPIKAQLSLPDFGPDSQDDWALETIKERKALADIAAGNIQSAIAKCANIWASLPGANYGQHENKLDALVASYTSAGGTLA